MYPEQDWSGRPLSARALGPAPNDPRRSAVGSRQSALLDVYGPVTLAALATVALGGPVVALGGALLPAGWAARSRTSVALPGWHQRWVPHSPSRSHLATASSSAVRSWPGTVAGLWWSGGRSIRDLPTTDGSMTIPPLSIYR